MVIYYTRENIFLEGRVYSPYLLGYAGRKWVSAARQEFLTEDYDCKDPGRMHFRMVKKYLRERDLLLYKWLKETNTPFGGLVGGVDDMEAYAPFYPVNLLFVPGSIEETAFRLCFEIKPGT